MTADIFDLFPDDPPVAKYDRAQADTECWKIFEYLQQVGRPACKAEIATMAGVDVSHVSQRIERLRNKLGGQVVGGKAGFGQDRLPLCECCKSPKSKGQQLYVLVSPDILTLAPRDIGLHLHEEGDEVTVDLETYEITERYEPWEQRRLVALVTAAYRKWKASLGKCPPEQS